MGAIPCLAHRDTKHVASVRRLSTDHAIGGRSCIRAAVREMPRGVGAGGLWERWGEAGDWDWHGLAGVPAWCRRWHQVSIHAENVAACPKCLCHHALLPKPSSMRHAQHLKGRRCELLSSKGRV